MGYPTIKTLLEQYKSGIISEDDFLKAMTTAHIENLEHTTLDHHRSMRLGFPEVIFCQNKTPKQVADIAIAMQERNVNFLGTRATIEQYEEVRKRIPQAAFNEAGRVITFQVHKLEYKPHKLLIITAGTSDIPVAEEAKETAKIMGMNVDNIYDIGVAGIHRVFHNWQAIHQATVIIIIAGMEGALPSVIGGLAYCPVIAVPTSVGYGASFQGLTPLLCMLNSCAPGVSVVNIDNGFGAVYCAYRIIKNL